MQNIVNNMCEKFNYDPLRKDRALGNGKADSNSKKKKNVHSAWGTVSWSKTMKYYFNEMRDGREENAREIGQYGRGGRLIDVKLDWTSR